MGTPARERAGRKIRVLIASPTRLVRDLLYEAISKEPDIEVVGEVLEESQIVPAVDITEPDCLILPLEPQAGRPRICQEVLAKSPRLRIVAIAEGLDTSSLYWLAGGIRCAFMTPSVESLLEALRDRRV
jgi:DNA-binding NarL/FixJ family response regulator